MTVDLSTNTAGIASPNPFWIASGPPGNTLRQVHLAFEAGWGGVVWKTVGAPVIDTAMRYGALHLPGHRLAGLNNIELISDRPAETNFREMEAAKAAWPDRAIIASLMAETDQRAWQQLVARAEAAGVDGLELNFGCPHGMSERNMGSAVGQVPEYVERITSWVCDVATVPVLVKLTPNITNIVSSARAAVAAGANGLSAINTINSITGVDIDTWRMRPNVDGLGTHGGYAGSAVKPIALHMISEIARDEHTRTTPISGIGGASTWRDIVEFQLLGASTVQVCTGVMQHGFRLVAELERGLRAYLESRGLTAVGQLVGGALSSVTEFGALDLNYQARAQVDGSSCIGCGKCIEVCRDNQVDCIDWERGEVRIARVDEARCIGCDLCSLVCPVDDCITMHAAERTKPPVTWRELTTQLGSPPGYCPGAGGVSWETFPAAIDGIVDSHGLG